MPSSEKLPMSIKLAYGLPGFAGAAMAIPIGVHMPRFYSDVILLPVGYIAIAIAIARAFDAITDPLMGWISDRTKTRWGRRKPWLVLGVPLCAISFWAMLSPPENITVGQGALWLGLTFGAYFLFHTVYIIPNGGWGEELTLDYHERTSLFGWSSFFITIGTVAASVLPVVLSGLGLDPRASFRVMGTLYACLLILLFGWQVYKVPERPEFYKRKSNPLIAGVRRVMRNRPFRIFLISGVLNAIPAAIPALLLPYLTYYVLMPTNPEFWLGLFLFLYLGCGALFLPFWIFMARKYGKKRIWLAVSVIGTLGGAALISVGPGDMVLFSVLLFIVGTQFSAPLFLGPAMLADVIDYDELHTGKRREAQFGSFLAIIPKFVAIPGAAIPIAFLGLIGYVPNQIQTPEVQMWIRVLYSLVPAAFHIAAFFVIVRYPLTEAVHTKIREGITKQKNGETVIDPISGQKVPPPTGGDVDEDTGWFLDNFSPGELGRYLRGGARALTNEVILSVVVSTAICVSGIWMAINSVGGLDTQPGPVTVISVVMAGLGLTAFLFHLIRILPSRQIDAKAIEPQTIKAHIEVTSRLLARQ